MNHVAVGPWWGVCNRALISKRLDRSVIILLPNEIVVLLRPNSSFIQS